MAPRSFRRLADQCRRELHLRYASVRSGWSLLDGREPGSPEFVSAAVFQQLLYRSVECTAQLQRWVDTRVDTAARLFAERADTGSAEYPSEPACARGFLAVQELPDSRAYGIPD